MTNTHDTTAFSSEPNIDLAIPDTCLGKIKEETVYLDKPFISQAQMMAKTQSLLRGAGVKHSITYCCHHGAYVKEMGNTISAEFYSNGNMRIVGAKKICRNRVCPLCSKIKSAQNIEEIQNFFIAAKLEGMKVVFFTFTKNKRRNIKNSMKEALSGIDKVNEAAKNWKNRKKVDIATCGIIEPSFSKEEKAVGNYHQKTCHIHCHGMVAYPAELSSAFLEDLKDKMELGWARGVKLAGGYVFTHKKNHEKVYKWKAVVDSQDAVQGLARYFNETLKGTDMGHELTSKTKDKEGRGIHTLLQDVIMFGCPQDTQLFIQYFKATIGEKPFRKSTRWRAMAKRGAELRCKVEDRLKDEAYHWVVEKHDMPIDTTIAGDIEQPPSELENVSSDTESTLDETLLQWKIEGLPKDSAPILQQITRHTFYLQSEVNRLNHIYCQQIQNQNHRESSGSDSGFDGIPAFQLPELEQSIIKLNNQIREINQDINWQKNIEEQEKQIRRDNILERRRVKLVDKVEFPVAIWEALTWHSRALWPVLDWLNREALKEEKSRIYSRFKAWLWKHRNYTDKDRRISAQIDQLDEYVEQIYQDIGLTRPSYQYTVKKRVS